ncbi:hypothetical protein [Arcobacter sp. F2176]|uniref:hypothetical protein n=1 Tax=Arcobacter sp. F2176 TaxID=2044511 RepID=UPI00100B5F43|nr:hypothetical protein [Arcobacter sp. F2176]RXJ80208.1 hypothetical protein CRU95_12060 [Arcobacter sp. F2176]
MLKNSSKQLLKFILVMFFSFSFSISAFAETENGAIVGNNSYATAYSMGYWKYASSTICNLKAGQDEAYFKFTAYKGDRLYVRTSYDSDYQGMFLEVLNNNYTTVDSSGNVVDPGAILSFIYVSKINATSNSQNFYIRIKRGNYTGDMIFSINVEDRIKSSSGKFNFNGTASNSGNPDILTNPNGVDSSIISMDLTNNSTIPNGAVVKSITTSGNLSRNLGGITHEILPSQTNDWYLSTVASARTGYYNIDLSNELNVAQKWDFRYNALARSSSTMSDVKATINYEYDLTKAFE